MTPSAKLVWLYLSAMAGERKIVGLSIESIGKALGLAHQTVIKAVRALVDEGLVERVRLGRYHSPTSYRLLKQPGYLRGAD